MALINIYLRTVLVLKASVPDSLLDAIPAKYRTRSRGANNWFVRFADDQNEHHLQPLKDRIRYLYSSHPSPQFKPASTRTFTVKQDHKIPTGREVDASSSIHRSIVLLLESPHKDEVASGQPASGTTGINLNFNRDALARMIHSVWPDQVKNVPVIVCNPCPYPSSCLASTSTWGQWRDMVFEVLFSHRPIRVDFDARLKAYKPKVILNACTDGVGLSQQISRLNVGAALPTGIYQPYSPKALVTRAVDSLCNGKFERHYFVKTSNAVAFGVDGNTAPLTFDERDGYIIRISHPSSRAWSWRPEPTPPI